MNIERKLESWLVAIAAGMIAMSSANAALTKLSIDYDTSYTGYVSWNGSTDSENVYLTAFQATRTGSDQLPFPHSDPFYTFCLDIGSPLTPIGWWQSGILPADGNNGNVTPYVNGGIQRAASLYNAYVGGVNFNSSSAKQQGAALQLAIWNVLYDLDNTVSSGEFKVGGGNSAVVASLADQMLGSSYNKTNPNLTSTFWNATDAHGNPVVNQDLIGPQLETGFVPEPATYLAGTAGLIYLAMHRIRRKQKRS